MRESRQCTEPGTFRNRVPAAPARPTAGVVAVLLAAAVAVIAGFVLSLGCGKDHPSNPGTPPAGLTFMRADSSMIVFPANAQTYVWCGPWGDEAVQAQAIHVLYAGSAEGQPGWALKAVVADVLVGVPMAFPNTFVWDHPDSAFVFVYDPPNEAASTTYSSRGWIEFLSLPCSTGGALEFSIDAVIGSEFWDGPPIRVRGTFRSEVTGAPQGNKVAPLR
jgi:hypothetical protein